MQLCGSLSILWHCLSLGLEWKLTFSSPVATAEFSKWVQHTECRTLTASSFWIWNSSIGIPSPPLALIIVMLPQAHLTLHSRMSGSRWMITPSRLSGSLRSFFFFGSILLCILAISSPSIMSVPFPSFIVPIFAWNVPLVSLIFLKRYLVFPILLFSSISLLWSLRKAISSLLTIRWNSAFR